MRKSNLLWVVAMSGALAGGCNKDESKPNPAPAAPSTPATPVTPPTVSTPSTPVIPSLPTTRPSVPDIQVPAIPNIPGTAPSSGTGTTGAGDAQAQPMIDEAKADINDKKWDDAQAILQKLQDMKDKLSPDLQKQVANLKTAIDAKNLKLPGSVPGLPATPDNK